MKSPSLKYSRLSETWQSIGLNPDFYVPDLKMTNSHIYCIFKDQILRDFDNFGQVTEIATSDRVELDENDEITYMQGENLCYLNHYYPIRPTGPFLIDRNCLYYSSVDFLDSQMIIKFDLSDEKEVCKSQLMKKMTKLMMWRDMIVVRHKNGVSILDKNLNINQEIDCNFLIDVQSIDNLIVLVSSELNVTKLNCYDINGNQKWGQELNGEFKTFTAGEDVVIISTENQTHCLDIKGQKKWDMPPVEGVICFRDKTEHLITSCGKILSIYESETGVLVWQEETSHPICGNPVVSENGFVVSSYNGGGIHCFGVQETWNLDFSIG